MVGWHHRFHGPELGQTPGDGEGHGSLMCCTPWGCEESDMIWQLKNEQQPFTSVGDFPNLGQTQTSVLQSYSFVSDPPGKPILLYNFYFCFAQMNRPIIVCVHAKSCQS